MSYPAELDAQGLHQWAARTVEELTRRRADINSLNVFPVPDSDTGSNMLHTMESALEEADKCTDPTAVAEARRGFLTELLVASLTVDPMNPRSHPNRRSSTGT